MGAKLTGINTNYKLSTFWEKEIIFDVPTKLHFVWIGKEIPQKYIDNILSFEKYNRQYEVIMALSSFSKLPFYLNFRYLCGPTFPLKRSERGVKISLCSILTGEV